MSTGAAVTTRWCPLIYTNRLVSPGWVIWADAPDKFEAGTPAIVNVIAFARALQLIKHFGNEALQDVIDGKLSAEEILYHDEFDGYSGRKLLNVFRQTLIGRGVLVPTTEGVKPFINLDNAASTPTFAPIWNAVCQTWRMIPNVSMIMLPVDIEGFIDLREMETLLCSYNEKGQHGKKRIRLLAVSSASNVLGVFNNLEEISRITHQYGARLLVDAAQMVAHRKIEIEKYRIDYLAFSAHKVYAPFGTGVLVVRKGLLNFNPAELDLIQSSGEENVVGIAALGKALLLLQRIGLDLIREEEQALTRRALRSYTDQAPCWCWSSAGTIPAPYCDHVLKGKVSRPRQSEPGHWEQRRGC
jgi:selenocysteine lyase/cysteine desulfurase